ncbi:MAG: NAD-dependent epimerase/dehydratase family protein [Magnetococcales bacterium]|nr:NAD-dependent epimerase/dehydratase family protein [Magnetococcales bacterium]MBF0148972.1 NAD-dependent epimerase/dehydratase family protein [Magnetococcales bacterium]MBF0603038.1 NAD-dependent epimerase/dehydratase family protein [Magnetococcales bacterium]
MKILILGGDGYLGWPTAMQLSALGHETAVVDNYLRREICRRVDVSPLMPTPTLHERVTLWKKISGHGIRVWIGDLTQWDFTMEVFQSFKPDAVIHYAEQPSAPYSMMDRRAASLTLHNNLMATLNIVFAVRDFCPDAHIVKLGTMGEYGTPNIDIEEGWIDIEHKGRTQKFLYPRQAGSLYHTTKIMDTDLLWFYVRVYGLAVTDLMQGPVYGLFTEENREHQALWPSFNYDELFGTVLNRFLVQAAIGYPLTVYGKGGQTRGYLNIMDTLNCVRLCVENPAPHGSLRIFNQFTETFSVNQLAERVCASGSRLGINVTIQTIPNPRVELEDHYYNPMHTGLLSLGLEPHYLTEERLDKMLSTVLTYREHIRKETIFRGVTWK